jgi:hypothetical protein
MVKALKVAADIICINASVPGVLDDILAKSNFTQFVKIMTCMTKPAGRNRQSTRPLINNNICLVDCRFRHKHLRINNWLLQFIYIWIKPFCILVAVLINAYLYY